MFERVENIHAVSAMAIALPMLTITICVLIGFTSIRLLKIVFGKD